MPKPSNPPLFYTVGHDGNVEYDTDITLRDLFAGMAMQGYLSEANALGLALAQKGVPEDKMHTVIAGMSYIQADAMLEARGE